MTLNMSQKYHNLTQNVTKWHNYVTKCHKNDTIASQNVTKYHQHFQVSSVRAAVDANLCDVICVLHNTHELRAIRQDLLLVPAQVRGLSNNTSHFTAMFLKLLDSRCQFHKR